MQAMTILKTVNGGGGEIMRYSTGIPSERKLTGEERLKTRGIGHPFSPVEAKDKKRRVCLSVLGPEPLCHSLAAGVWVCRLTSRAPQSPHSNRQKEPLKQMPLLDPPVS